MKAMCIFMVLLVLCCNACSPKQTQEANTSGKTVITIDAGTIVSAGYIGNGVQWDPYQSDYGNGTVEISAADWDKLYKRLDFMRPQFIRVMINTTSQLENGQFVPEKNFQRLSNILDYCQSRHVTVMFGDWGGGMVNARTGEINAPNLTYAAAYLDFLVNQKGYSCIQYYNMINEPNGDWSVTNTSYSLWRSAVLFLHEEMKRLDLTGKVGIVGPDIAIWGTGESWWIDSCATQLGEVVQLYDIHTYPSKSTVNAGIYSDIIRAYQNKIPVGKKIIMGEIGFKFVEQADEAFQKENIRRAQSKKYASVDDSQMFVYDYMYGIDMADALFQTLNNGFSGTIAWMLDDAMHSKEAPDKLKVWGFWNILGDEYFGSEEEIVRPWFYAWSLLTKHIPAGASVYKTTVTGDASVKAVFTGKDGRYLLAVVNVSDEAKTIKIESQAINSLSGCRKFIYADGALIKSGDHGLLPNDTDVTLNMDSGETMHIRPQTLLIFTTFDD
jgi:hypothetical protein